MKTAQIMSRENATMIYVPIVVEGEANGPIKVTVEMSSPASGMPAAVEQKDYYVTSKTVNIPAGVSSVNVQLYPVWERGVINDDIAFDVKIIDAKGATIGNLTSTEVVLADADKDPYNKIQGQWNMNGKTLFQGASDGPFSVTIEAAEEFIDNDPTQPNPEYGRVLYVKGFGGEGFLKLPINYRYNEETKVVRLYTSFGSLMGSASFTGLGDCDLKIITTTGNTPNEVGVINYTVDEDFTKITNETPEVYMMIGVYQKSEFLGWYDGFTDVDFYR